MSCTHEFSISIKSSERANLRLAKICSKTNLSANLPLISRLLTKFASGFTLELLSTFNN